MKLSLLTEGNWGATKHCRIISIIYLIIYFFIILIYTAQKGLVLGKAKSFKQRPDITLLFRFINNNRRFKIPSMVRTPLRK